MNSQMEAKKILMEEQIDEISALRSHCDTLQRTLDKKDDEALLIQQAMVHMGIIM
ncbi:hypothetical protein DIPPA_34355 [Diplonema papillatum]|nr:hypothetical protein DIPPA_34355 [Diplonema papillatum]